MDEDTLISIIVFNQKKIEELLISRCQIPNAKVRNTIAGEAELDHTQPIRDNLKSIHVDLQVQDIVTEKISTTLDYPASITKSESSLIVKNVKNFENISEKGQVNRVIVDHAIPLIERISKPYDYTDIVSDTLLVSKHIQDEIPGIGCINNESMLIKHAAGVLNDVHKIKFNNFKMKEVNKKDNNTWIINKRGKCRKKAQSSSTIDDINSQPEPSPKRKRCNSSSFLCSNSKTFTNAAETRHFFKAETSSVIENKRKETTNLVIEIKSDSTDSAKQKKTKILSPYFKNKQSNGESSGLNVNKCSSFGVYAKAYNTWSSTCLEPYISCWAHCPAITTRQSQANRVPKSQFMEHLKQYHGMAKSINLFNQQIVCICSNCETVVQYDYGSKKEHNEKRCINIWRQHFYLFMENTQDDFAVKWFNAPVVMSPGFAHIVRSVAYHPHLDTLTWKNLKHEYFCYHYCSFCNTFVEDEKIFVSSHTSSTIHRINFRKSGHQQQ